MMPALITANPWNGLIVEHLVHKVPVYIFYSSIVFTDASVKGVQTQEQFVGCIRNLQLNDKPQPLFSGQVTGDIQIDSCPVN